VLRKVRVLRNVGRSDEHPNKEPGSNKNRLNKKRKKAEKKAAKREKLEVKKS